MAVDRIEIGLPRSMADETQIATPPLAPVTPIRPDIQLPQSEISGENLTWCKMGEGVLTKSEDLRDVIAGTLSEYGAQKAAAIDGYFQLAMKEPNKRSLLKAGDEEAKSLARNLMKLSYAMKHPEGISFPIIYKHSDEGLVPLIDVDLLVDINERALSLAK